MRSKYQNEIKISESNLINSFKDEKGWLEEEKEEEGDGKLIPWKIINQLEKTWFDLTIISWKIRGAFRGWND